MSEPYEERQSRLAAEAAAKEEKRRIETTRCVEDNPTRVVVDIMHLMTPLPKYDQRRAIIAVAALLGLIVRIDGLDGELDE